MFKSQSLCITSYLKLGFIHTFYIIFPHIVSGIWYLIFVYVKPNILPFFSNYSQTSIEIFSYISIQSLFIYTYSKSRHLALQLTDTTLLDHCVPDYPDSAILIVAVLTSMTSSKRLCCTSKCAGVLFNLVLHHFH